MSAGADGRWELVTGTAAFQDLRADWERLYASNAAHSPFAAWGWVAAWLEHLAGSHELRIVTWRDDAGALRFVLPLIARTRGRIVRRRTRVLACSYGPDCSDHLGPLRDPSIETETAEFAARGLRMVLGDKAYIVLDALTPAADLAGKLGSLMHSAGRQTRIADRFACPRVTLPADWDEFLKGFSSNFRSQIRRSVKRVREEDELQFRTVPAGEASGFTERLMELNRVRMQDKGIVSSLEADRFRSFLPPAVEYMAGQGIAWMDVIERDGNVIGAALNFVHGSTAYYYMGGFDPGFEKIRPGTALFALVIQRCMAGGVTAYDFLRGREGYKYRWGAEDTILQRLDAYPNSLLSGRMAYRWDQALVASRRIVRKVLNR